MEKLLLLSKLVVETDLNFGYFEEEAVIVKKEENNLIL
jgi:hypothetical protein